MSSETNQSSYVTSVSYSFVLKWILKGKDLKFPSEDASFTRSDIYRFEAAKDLRFYLELLKHGYDYVINVRGSKSWSFELAYAILVMKEEVYYVKASSQLSFLSSFPRSQILDEEDVPIHCVVIADPLYPPPTSEDDPHPKEGQNTVDIEVRPNIILPENYSNKAVSDFIRRGAIPNFDVFQAIEIIRDITRHKCEVLKILSVQYLMKNITSQSLSLISKAAIDCDLPVLQRACMQMMEMDNSNKVTDK